jgi:hypothetical protein
MEVNGVSDVIVKKAGSIKIQPLYINLMDAAEPIVLFKGLKEQ